MGANRFNFKQKPTGLFRRILHSPVWVFRARLGFLFGRRIVMLEHVGRRSGKTRQTPLEVVHRDDDAFILCSGTGPDADWYRNLKSNPAQALWVGSHRHEVDQRFLVDSEAATTFAGYEQAHPKAAARLTDLMGVSHDGTHGGRMEMVAKIPMVELRLRG
jgi:deazaflavin-dependent oxidoreductase (nitroreductase family)